MEITVRKPMKLCSFGVWGLKDTDVLTNSLPNADLQYKNGGITGTADAQSGQSLFLSVPWYNGIKVRVNGQTVHVKQVLDCFMEIPLPGGHSEITVSYIPMGIIPGTVISISAILLVIIYRMFRGKHLVHVATDIWYRCAPTALKLGFIAVMLIVYMLPLVLWATKFTI